MKKRGFTLIELLAVIVVLAVIALIATQMVLNTIEEAKKGAAKSSALNYIKEIEIKVARDLIKNERYENKDDYAYDEIAVEMKGKTPTGGEYSLENGIIKTAYLCVNGYEVNYSNNKATVGGKCSGEDIKEKGGIEISTESLSEYYNLQETKTFEITKNISGVALSCTSSDESVATCSIEGKTLTVT